MRRKEAEKSLLKESPPPRSRTAHKNGSYSASAPEKRILLFAEKINFFLYDFECDQKCIVKTNGFYYAKNHWGELYELDKLLVRAGK